MKLYSETLIINRSLKDKMMHAPASRSITQSIWPLLELKTRYTYRQAERQHHLNPGNPWNLYSKQNDHYLDDSPSGVSRVHYSIHILTWPYSQKIRRLIESFFNQSPAVYTVGTHRPHTHSWSKGSLPPVVIHHQMIK